MKGDWIGEGLTGEAVGVDRRRSETKCGGEGNPHLRDDDGEVEVVRVSCSKLFLLLDRRASPPPLIDHHHHSFFTRDLKHRATDAEASISQPKFKINLWGNRKQKL